MFTYKIAHESFPILLILLAIAAVSVPAAFWFHRGIGIGTIVFFSIGLVFTLFFFREPKIDGAFGNPAMIYSPAYGHVLSIEETGNKTVIRIFLSVFDVHVQYAPLSGIIRGIHYYPGEFNMAFDKNAANNERNRIEIISSSGQYISVEQIAGFIARRISCTVKAGDTLNSKRRIGMIRFGSQVAVYLPGNISVLVSKGQFVTPAHAVAEFKN